MKGNIYAKNIRRTIWGSIGRYMAILAIIALGVGFFSGVKNTKNAMMLTCDRYVSEHSMYDIQLISTYGFDEKDVEAVRNEKHVAKAEGAYSADFFSDYRKNTFIYKAFSIADGINELEVKKGRMPGSGRECIADSNFFTEEDIGKTVTVADKNTKQTKEILRYKEYKITGLADSPYYMTREERGTTSIGDGNIAAFIYIPEEGFDSEYYTEMFVVSEKQGFVFSDEYENNIDRTEPAVRKAAEDRLQIRFDKIVKDAQDEIDKGQKELDQGRSELQSAKDETYGQLGAAKSDLDSRSSQIRSGKRELSSQKDTLDSQKKQVQQGIRDIQGQIDMLPEGTPPETSAALEEQRDELQGSLDDINGGLALIESEQQRLESAQEKLAGGYSRYDSGVAEAAGRFSSAESELDEGEAKLERSRKDLKKLEEPELFVMTRDDNMGFSSYESNADIINSIAKIFPVFFFLIAALVCSTTMSRMIEEERTQIGALSALGYTTGKIMRKYMIYSGSASMLGCIIGFLAGSKYFPEFIWIAYSMMFGFAPIEFYFNWKLAVISLIVSLLCSTGTTYFACRGQLKHMPAEILRPPAPKPGKRIFLEKIGFVWKHMRFLHKVSARNIFRYKKRMIMMILGISGCTALVLAGFGINDSISGIVDRQYTEIDTYHMAVAFEDLNDRKAEEFTGEFDGQIAHSAQLDKKAVTVKNGDMAKTCSFMISEDDKVGDNVSFRDEKGGKLDYPGDGEVMINNKLAELLKVKAGDKVKLTYDEEKNAELVVSGVYRNYVQNYVYISGDTYEKSFGEKYEPSLMFVTLEEGVDEYGMAEKMNRHDGVIRVSINQEVRNRVDDMMVSLNYIIILVIACAGALAFIVLFNLGNINITEREREIATIEVLGFYPRETASYVFRENFILVLIGIIVGIPAGFALHSFIMSNIIVDFVSFNEVIRPASVFFTVLTVIGFDIIVELILRKKLRKINMAESLKSVE